MSRWIYSINLMEVQAAHPEITSKKALRPFFASTPFVELELICGHMRLAAASPLCGISLAQSQMRRKYGVTVIAILRDGVTQASPEPNDQFQADDVVYLFGKTDKLLAIAPLFSGPLRESGKETSPPPKAA